MICDICSTPGSFTAVSSGTMRSAVRGGFNPFTLGLAKTANTALGLMGVTVSLSDQFADWKTRLDRDTTDWNVCPKCKSHLDTCL